MNLTAKEVALVACMAAVYVALSYLPGFLVIGAENVKIGIVSGIARSSVLFWDLGLAL